MICFNQNAECITTIAAGFCETPTTPPLCRPEFLRTGRLVRSALRLQNYPAAGAALSGAHPGPLGLSSRSSSGQSSGNSGVSRQPVTEFDQEPSAAIKWDFVLASPLRDSGQRQETTGSRTGSETENKGK